MARNVVSDQDVELAISTFNELTVIPHGAQMSEIGRLIHNDNLFEAMVGVTESTMANQIADENQKLPVDKIKHKARASKEYLAAVRKAAMAKGELGAARLRVVAATNMIEIWRSQSANNRKGHL
jgi:hypothetical protein